MGQDAYIDLELNHEAAELDGIPHLLEPYDIYDAVPGCAAPGATHTVGGLGRYWSPEYRNGSWPQLAMILLTLLGSGVVKRVWYYSDCSEEPLPLTAARLRRYSDQYMGV